MSTPISRNAQPLRPNETKTDAKSEAKGKAPTTDQPQPGISQDQLDTANRMNAGSVASQVLQPDQPHPAYADFLRRARQMLEIVAFSEDGVRQVIALGAELAAAVRRGVTVRIVTTRDHTPAFQRLPAAGIQFRFLDPDDLDSSAEMVVLRDGRGVMAHSALLAPDPKDLSETDAWQAIRQAFDTDWARGKP